ncbi:MAG TPA: hypothetical protein VGM01_01195 [Ktedonobacteraceae bacterium]
MFYIMLLFLILLGILALIIAVQNYGILLSTNIHLIFVRWSLPGIPVLLLCVLGIFLGALALYVIAARAARRDEREIKVLRARIEELEALPEKSPSGGLSASFAPSVVPLPGFSAGASLNPSGPPKQPGPAGPLSPIGPGPAGPLGPTGPGPAGSMNQWQPPSNPLQNMSPSASGSTSALSPRPFPPQQQPPQSPQQQQQPPQQMGGPRPPFPRS